jgi:hypothetical protein
MLDANPWLQLTAVDLGVHSYTRECAEIIDSRYPGRFHILYGPSRESLPSLLREQQFGFEIIHIDGGHGPKDVEFDFDFVLRNAASGSIIVIDDAYIVHIKALIAIAELEGYLKVANTSLPATGENRVFVRTNKPFSQSHS